MMMSQEIFANRYEVQLDEVNSSSRFDVDISNKAIRVNNFGSVIRFITYNAEICNTSTTLDVAEEWLN